LKRKMKNEARAFFARAFVYWKIYFRPARAFAIGIVQFVGWLHAAATLRYQPYSWRRGDPAVHRQLRQPDSLQRMNGVCESDALLMSIRLASSDDFLFHVTRA